MLSYASDQIRRQHILAVIRVYACEFLIFLCQGRHGALGYACQSIFGSRSAFVNWGVTQAHSSFVKKRRFLQKLEKTADF